MTGVAELTMSFAGNASLIASKASGLLLLTVPAIYPNEQKRGHPPNEEIEKLNQKIEDGEKKLRRLKHEEKMLQHRAKQLTRNERTHRLCIRGAALENLKIPIDPHGA